MITKVEFENFKALRDVSVDLERLTVLVGPNASGKTSVLEGLYYLSEMHRNKDQMLGESAGVRDLVTRGAGDDVTLKCFGDQGDLCITRRLHQIEPQWKRVDKTTEILSVEKQGSPTNVIEADLETGGFPDFGPAGPLRLEMSKLVEPSYSEDEVPHLASDGKGLASVLAYMASNRPDDYQKIQDLLHEVVPSVLCIRTPRASIKRLVQDSISVNDKRYDRLEKREYWGQRIEFDMEGAPSIPAYLASEGTMLVLGLLTVILGPDRPRLALLDDLDRALHPRAQRHLVALLRRLLERGPDLQIVATSHSPYFLDDCQHEEIRLTTRKEDGSVAIGRLDQHPDFEKWKEEMSPGEFWSLVGEEWVAETVVEK